MIGSLKASLPLILAGITILIGDANQAAVAIAQMQADRGSISGTVTELATGLPLEDICVTAEDFSVGSGSFAFTDALGAYEISGLVEGAYQVRFGECFSSSETYFPIFYDGQPDRDSADLVPVTAGVTTSGVDAQMPIGGVISGSVTEEETGAPLVGECVIFTDLSFNFSNFTITDESGQYSQRVRNGDYKVRFSVCGGQGGAYIDEWYDNRGDFDSADVISVSEGSDVSGTDAQIAAGMFGDVNCSGTVNAIDAALLLQFDARLLFDPSLGPIMLCLALGDVNGDRVQDAIDASLVLRLEAGLLDSLRSN